MQFSSRRRVIAYDTALAETGIYPSQPLEQVAFLAAKAFGGRVGAIIVSGDADQHAGLERPAENVATETALAVLAKAGERGWVEGSNLENLAGAQLYGMGEIPVYASDGVRLATLCVLDTEERLGRNMPDAGTLNSLASLAASHLERPVHTPPPGAEPSSSWNVTAPEVITVGRWSWDVLLGRFRWSSGLSALFGHPKIAREGTMMDWLAQVHPADVEEMLASLFPWNGNKPESDAEYRVVRPDGQVIRVVQTGKVRYDEDGRIISCAGICWNAEEDIGLGQTAEPAAPRAEKALPAAFLYELPAARVSYCGTTLPRLLGCTLQALRHFHNFLFNLGHPDDRPAIQAYLENHFTAPAGTFFDVEFRIRHADGSWRRIALHSLVVGRNAAGQPLQALMQAKEAGAHPRSDEESHRLQRQLQLAIDTIPQRIFWKDLDGRYLGCNLAFAKDAGFSSPAELIGRDDLSLNYQPLGLAYRANDRLVTDFGQAKLDYEDRLSFGDGSLGWIRTSKVPLYDDSGTIIGIVGTYEDITEQRRTQDQLRSAKETAEVAAKAKGEFLANISHEIRTPLSGMLGVINLLRESTLTVEQRNWIEVAQASGQALLRLLNNILDFSKADAGKLLVEHVVFDLRRLISECVELLRPPADAKDLPVFMDCPYEIPDALIGDPSKVRQILLNYIGNAVKFTATGSIEVKVRALRNPERGSVPIRIEVTDTGIGIPKHLQDHLFQPFTQADGSTTREFGGTGLGLSITKQLALRLGGTVGLESDAGLGSTFWVELPFAIAPKQEPLPKQTPPLLQSFPDRPPLRALLVEDNEVNQLVARRMLERLGCTVEVAQDGHAALRKWSSGEYDIIFMDCQMPGLDGYQATEEIRQMESVLDLPHTTIVALTAHTLPGDRDRCFAAGMNDYLTKPLRLDQLQRVLAHWIEASASAGPSSQSEVAT